MSWAEGAKRWDISRDMSKRTEGIQEESLEEKKRAQMLRSYRAQIFLPLIMMLWRMRRFFHFCSRLFHKEGSVCMNFWFWEGELFGFQLLSGKEAKKFLNRFEESKISTGFPLNCEKSRRFATVAAWPKVLTFRVWAISVGRWRFDDEEDVGKGKRQASAGEKIGVITMELSAVSSALVKEKCFSRR